MRARDIKGKKVVAVRQIVVTSSGGERVHCLDEIEFEGGVLLRFLVCEERDAGDYGVEGIVVKP